MSGLFSASSPGGERSCYADFIFALLWHRCPQGLGNGLCTGLFLFRRTGDTEKRVSYSLEVFGEPAVLVVRPEGNPRSHGIDRRLLETGLAGTGRSLPTHPCQSLPGEEHSRPEDRRSR